MGSRRPPGAVPLESGPWPARDAQPKGAGERKPRPPGALPLDPLPRPVPATALGRAPTHPGLTIDDGADVSADDDNSVEKDVDDHDDDDRDGRRRWDDLGPTESFAPPPMTMPTPPPVGAFDEDLGPTESLTIPIPHDALSTMEAQVSSSASSASSALSASPASSSSAQAAVLRPAEKRRP